MIVIVDLGFATSPRDFESAGVTQLRRIKGVLHRILEAIEYGHVEKNPGDEAFYAAGLASLSMSNPAEV